MGTIDEYLAQLDPLDAAVIARVYDVARAVVPEAEQGTSYGMPALVYRGKGLLSVMRTKKHIGLYPYSGQVLGALAELLAAFGWDKGTLRFQPDAPPDDRLVELIVSARCAEIDLLPERSAR
jgi:uncharacterized protein YdhG (YjbR/CyaY superfamily)